MCLWPNPWTFIKVAVCCILFVWNMVFQWAFLGLMLNFEHLVLSILAINRAQSSVSISPLLKTVWRSQYNILYFTVLLNRCLMDIYSTSQYFPHITYVYTSSIMNSIHSSFKDLSKSVSQIHHLKTEGHFKGYGY